MTEHNDEIYGPIFLDPVITELMETSPFQRLKHIHQGGGIFLVDPTQRQNRYDHSLGVYHLVARFGGSLQERTMALLHDISHTAFSHVGDYVLGYAEEDYHESIFNKTLSHPAIQRVLEKYGLTDIFDHMGEYTLLEQPLPAICADRIDYTLRDLYHAGIIDQVAIKAFLDDVQNQGGKLVIASKTAADWFSLHYRVLNEQYFRRADYLFANHQLTELLKEAIAGGGLLKEDLLLNDLEVMAKLVSAGYGGNLDSIAAREGFDKFDVSDAAARIKKRELGG